MRDMMTGEAAELFAGHLGVPASMALLRAKQLRAARMLTKAGRGPRSGAHLTNVDAIRWLLALALDHGRGDDVAANVSRFVALPRDEASLIMPASFADGLSFQSAPTAGDALAALLGDMRSPCFLDWWGEHPGRHLMISVYQPVPRIWIGLSQPSAATADRLPAGALISYGEDATQRPNVERQLNIGGPVLFRLAEAMGPAAPD